MQEKQVIVTRHKIMCAMRNNEPKFYFFKNKHKCERLIRELKEGCNFQNRKFSQIRKMLCKKECMINIIKSAQGKESLNHSKVQKKTQSKKVKYLH